MIELVFEDAHFQDIKNGKKTVIGKIDADLQGIKKGDTVIFFKDVGNKSNSSEKISVKVQKIHKFNDVPSMLKKMMLKKILPRSKSYKDGEKVFEETYGNRLKDAKFIAFTFDIVENAGPRIKNKNGEPNGPRVKKNKNSEPNGPLVKKNKIGDKSEDEDEEKEEEEETANNGPRIKNKKNGELNSPRVKNNKNSESNNSNHNEDEDEETANNGPRIKNKKNGDSNGPRIKNKKNGNAPKANRPPRDFEMTIREPWFSLIENGQKQVEGRLFRGIVEEFRVNDTIHFINKMNNKEKKVSATITKLTKYPNFRDLLFHEKLYKVLPGYPDIKCGNVLFEKIYNFNQIREFGALAIEIKVI